MRTTLRIDDDLMSLLRKLAEKEGVGLGEMVNRLLRRGLESANDERQKAVSEYRQQTYPMGKPFINLDKAMAFAAQLEDEEILKKLALGK